MIIRDDNTPVDTLRLSALLGELALTGPLSIARVARHLGTSPRTLQRHLARRQLTYRGFVDEARLRGAQTLLSKTDLSVQEIASCLGYRTPSAFSRAFRRWTGRSPRAYRAAITRLRSPTENLARNG